MDTNFEWDETKRQTNIRKHGIDFVDVPSVFGGVTVTIEDNRYDYGETRFITLGLLKRHVIVVVHTERDQNIRIISARKATRHESELYFKQIAD
jgi:uncharacterized DUF497 family protein